MVVVDSNRDRGRPVDDAEPSLVTILPLGDDFAGEGQEADAIAKTSGMRTPAYPPKSIYPLTDGLTENIADG